jgi:glutamate--cysteine ligase
VRPRGHLELRVVDAQRTEADAAAALILGWALCSDAQAADAALDALKPVPADDAVLTRARRAALTDPELALAARGSYVASLGALDRLGAAEVAPVLESFAERYVDRGRCPADDTLDAWNAGKELPCPARAS